MQIIPKRIRQWLTIREIKSKVRECELQKTLTGKQQFLIKLNNEKLVIVTAKYVDAYNKVKGTGYRKMTYLDLCNMAIYKTN